MTTSLLRVIYLQIKRAGGIGLHGQVIRPCITVLKELELMTQNDSCIKEIYLKFSELPHQY